VYLKDAIVNAGFAARNSVMPPTAVGRQRPVHLIELLTYSVHRLSIGTAGQLSGRFGEWACSTGRRLMSAAL
jgi:hypothetical protein